MLILTLHHRTHDTHQELAVPECAQLTLGRDARVCDVVLDHPTVSRRHLRVEVHDDRLVISDDRSTSGSLLNGRRLTGRQQITPDDVVSLGGLERLRRLVEAGERGAASRLWRIGRRRADRRLCFEAALWARPDPLTWHVLVECLEHCPRDLLLEAVARAERRLLGWPAALRGHVPSWWQRVRAGIDEPRWRLVRTLHLETEALEDLRIWHHLLEGGVFEHLAQLEIARCTPTVEALRQLTDAATLPSLRVLSLEGCPLGGHPALGVLLESALASRLESLSLEHCALDDDAALMIARAETLRGLRRLVLHGNAITDRGAASFGRSPVLGGLEHFDLTDNPIGQPGVAALRMSVRLPQAALRHGPG